MISGVAYHEPSHIRLPCFAGVCVCVCVCLCVWVCHVRASARVCYRWKSSTSGSVTWSLRRRRTCSWWQQWMSGDLNQCSCLQSLVAWCVIVSAHGCCCQCVHSCMVVSAHACSCGHCSQNRLSALMLAISVYRVGCQCSCLNLLVVVIFWGADCQWSCLQLWFTEVVVVLQIGKTAQKEVAKLKAMVKWFLGVLEAEGHILLCLVVLRNRTVHAIIH